MGAVCGHLNDLLLKQTSVGNLAVSRPPCDQGLRESQSQGFASLGPGGGNARYFRLFKKGYFC